MDYKEAIIDYLLINDPKQEIVAIDTTNQTITYHPSIKCHQNPKFENEGFVRAYLIVRLVKELGYPLESIEIENDLDVNIGRTKKSKGIKRGRSDVLVFDNRSAKEGLFLGIECKTPDDFEAGKKDIDGQLWGISKAASIETRIQKVIRYLCLFTVEYIGGELHDKVIVIDYQKYPTYTTWGSSSSPYSNALPSHYGDAPQNQFANLLNPDSERGLVPLNKSYRRSDFEKLRSSLHNKLWAGSSTDDNTIFHQLTKVFLVKIYDELHTDPDEPYEVQIRQTSAGLESPDELYLRLNKRYNSACRQMLNYTDEDLNRFPFLEAGITKTKLYVAVQEIQSVSLTENDDGSFDVLGAFFEGIMTNQDFFKQSKGTYFTHPNLVKFIIAMVGVDKIAIECIRSEQPRLPYIIDPSNGSGTFLIEVMKYVTNRVNSIYPELKLNRLQQDFYNSAFKRLNKPNAWAEDYIYGIEPRAELGLAAKVNMILHGDGNMNIFITDGLHPFRLDGTYHYDRKWQNKDPGMLADSKTSELYNSFEVNENFDFVISNPPFSLATAALDSAKTHKDTFVFSDASNSENLFIERHYQLLRPGGKLGIVLPESVFDTTDNKYIRFFIYKYFKIDAVVSLPQEAFKPFTTTKVSLLFATKKTEREINDFNEAWKGAEKRYSKLRSSASVQAVIDNDRLLNGNYGLIDLCSKFDIQVPEYYRLLDSLVFSDDLEKTLNSKISELPESTKKQKEEKDRCYQSLADIDHFVSKDLFHNLPDSELDILKEFLKHFYPTGQSTVYDVCEYAYDEIIRVARLDYPNFLDKQRYTNLWWCFATVTQQPNINHKIYFAEIGNIGYKRTKRGEYSQPNDLYQEDQDGFPVADIDTPETALDFYEAWKKSTELQGSDLKNGSYAFNANLSDISSVFDLGCRVSLVRFIQEEFKHLQWNNLTKLRRKMKSYRSGDYIAKSNYSDEESDLVYLSVSNFSGEKPDLKNVTYLKDELLKEYEKKRIQSGSLIITRSGTVGYAHIVELDDEKVYIPSHHLLVIELTDDAKASVFLQYWMKSKFVRDFLWNFSQGKSQKELTNWSVKTLPIPQAEFNEEQVNRLTQIGIEIEETEIRLIDLRQEIDNLVQKVIESE